MIPPQFSVINNDVSGHWEIYVDPKGTGQLTNVTKFRGAATTVNEMSTTDPFGPNTASLTFPTVTLLDKPGQGDLWWLLPEANVDICWVHDEQILYSWQGYFVSFEYNEEDIGSNLSVQCNGALKQLDNYLAKPEYLYQPLAYEYAIYRQFTGKPELRLNIPNHPSTAFPDWWDKTFSINDYNTTDTYLLPLGPMNGDKWSGMVTRETGSFDEALSSYIQGLLSNMYTERGQFTLLLGDNRTPVLTHRDIKTRPDEQTLVVDLLWPGVNMTASIDYSQRLNVVYGQGTSLSGNVFSNQQVTADGSRSFYEPFAYRREVYPADTANNPWYKQDIMRKEVSLSFYKGMDASEATDVAKKHLQRFSDPGVTGSLNLKADPLVDGIPYPRQLIQAGMTIQIKGLFGNPEGMLFHITEQSINAEGEVSLTLDSKFRDQLTVQEVRLRGRDSLVPVRMLSAGQFQPLIPDLLYPWSYDQGSGFMPIGALEMFNRGITGTSDQNALTTFSDLYATGYDFPWEGLTAKFPPSKYPEFYVMCEPANDEVPDSNWVKSRVRLGAQGDIRLLQVAAFWEDGSVAKVPFHISFYMESSTSVEQMPSMPSDYAKFTPYPTYYETDVSAVADGENVVFTSAGHNFVVDSPVIVRSPTGTDFYENYGNTILFVKEVTTDTFTVASKGTALSASGLTVDLVTGSHYPFYPNAFEKYLEDGSARFNEQTTVAATIFAGYGNYFEKAGYWPNTSSRANTTPLDDLVQSSDFAPTGLLSDEAGFSFNFIGGTRVDEYASPQENQQKVASVDMVTAAVMIYCDQRWDDVSQQLVALDRNVYFLARLYRKNPGV